MENNSPKNRKVWFITGASKGFGLELTKQLLATGHQVAATTRRLANLEGALGRENDNFLPLEVDLINEVSVKNAVSKAVRKFGTVDVVVNNAGYGQFGYIEEISDSLLRKQFDINVFGTVNVSRRPACFEKTTLGTYLQHLIDGRLYRFSRQRHLLCLQICRRWPVRVPRDEVADFGIAVTCVKPGNFRTDFLADSMQFEDSSIEDYTEKREAFHVLLKGMNHKQGRRSGQGR